MRFPNACPLSFRFAFALSILTLGLPTVRGAESVPTDFRPRFLQLCDLAATEINVPGRKEPFFVDSYAVRALCVAYDMTGKKEYLDACRKWSEHMLTEQAKMIPRWAYYMNYNRKPAEDKGGWYVADSSSIAMGVLATAVRCSGAEKQRFLDSARQFAALVMDNYIGPGGGIRNGLWPKFDGEWWCSSGIFGSLAFLLYDETGEERYLKTALGTVGWLNRLELAKAEPYPVSEMGPTMPMYVLEAYSAGLRHLQARNELRKAALARIDSTLEWVTAQQQRPPLQRQWPANVRWGMKFGGLPFHEYVASRVLPDGPKLIADGDREMAALGSVVFTNKIAFTQLPVFMMMSYAERLSPGDIYKSSRPVRKP
jgi:hypothetical protein